jgi:hypothetical protein
MKEVSARNMSCINIEIEYMSNFARDPADKTILIVPIAFHQLRL